MLELIGLFVNKPTMIFTISYFPEGGKNWFWSAWFTENNCTFSSKNDGKARGYTTLRGAKRSFTRWVDKCFPDSGLIYVKTVKERKSWPS